jgi:hypothetical protein
MLGIRAGASQAERRKPLFLQEAAISDCGRLPGLVLSLVASYGVGTA